MIGGSMLGTIAGVVIGSAIAQAFLPDPSAFEAGPTGPDASGDTGADSGADAGASLGGCRRVRRRRRLRRRRFGDFGGGDFGGGDFGGDFGGRRPDPAPGR